MPSVMSSRSLVSGSLLAKVCPVLLAAVFGFQSMSAYTDGRAASGSSADTVSLNVVPWAETASVWCSIA